MDAHRAHNPEYTGSNPVPATQIKIIKKGVRTMLRLGRLHHLHLQITQLNKYVPVAELADATGLNPVEA